MNLVDKEHIALFETGEHGRQVPGALQHRARGTLDLHAHFLGDDIGQRGLAQAGWTEDEQMIQRLAASAGSGHEQLHLLAHRRLTYVVGQAIRPDGPINHLFLLPWSGGDQAVFFQHGVSRVNSFR